MHRFQSLNRGLAVLGVAVLALAGPGPAVLAAAQPVTARLTAAGPATAGPATAGPGTAGPATGPSWRVRDLAREGATLRTAAQVISVSRRDVFALLPTSLTSPQVRLERFAVTGGHVLHGPVFAVGRLLLASGFAWVYGEIPARRDSPFAKQVLYQVSEQTLAVVRSWNLTPRHRASFLDDVEVAPGPGQSVWVGFQRTLLRISTATGAIIGREPVPAGVFVDGLATDPGRRHLYVGAEPRRGGATVLEYLARSGRQLAPAGGRKIRFALNGPGLTGVPGGAFGVYRTGMAGQVIRLSQRGLRIQPLRGRVFSFMMFASLAYSRGAVFLADDGGLTGCLSAQGAVRHTTTIGALRNISADLLAADPSAHLVYAVGPHGLIAITPPTTCWG